jgi:hypothetical protein
MTKSKKMRWAGHAIRMGEKRNVYRVLVGDLEANRHPRRSGREDNIKRILEKKDGRYGLDSSGLGGGLLLTQ